MLKDPNGGKAVRSKFGGPMTVCRSMRVFSGFFPTAFLQTCIQEQNEEERVKGLSLGKH